MIEFFRELAFRLGQGIYFEFFIENPTGMIIEIGITLLLWMLIKNSVLRVLAQIVNAAAWLFLAYCLLLHGHEVFAMAYAAIIPMMIYQFFDAERSAARKKAKKAEKRSRAKRKSSKAEQPKNE